MAMGRRSRSRSSRKGRRSAPSPSTLTGPTLSTSRRVPISPNSPMILRMGYASGPEPTARGSKRNCGASKRILGKDKGSPTQEAGPGTLRAARTSTGLRSSIEFSAWIRLRTSHAFEKALQQIFPEDRAKFIGILDAAIRDKKDFDVEWRFPLPDGSLRYHHSVGHPIVDKDGEVVEYVGTLVDVTEQYLAKMALERENAERRRAEEELRRSEFFLAEGQRISRTGSWAWNVTTGEVSWSAEHFRIFGLDPDAATPSYAAFVDRIHPEDRPGFDDMLEKAVRDGNNFEWDFRIVTPDGATKYLHSLGHLTAYGAENTEFVGTIMDVTERRVAEEALRGALGDLERASRLNTMGQLTASIAHEINQPLAAIITNAEACLLWLEADRPDLEEARQAATRIVRNGHRAGDIIKSVRALTRKSTLEMVPLDINNVIREVIVLLGGEFRRRGVRVEASLSPDLGSVVGDFSPASAGRAEFDHEWHRGHGGVPARAAVDENQIRE